jgi:hypothetical protein
MKGCWRLTDNRYWNSPARMSDGRLFTNYKSSGLIAKDIQDRIGIDKGKQTYRDYLQANANILLEEQNSKAYANAFTLNSYANTYAPPPPENTIHADQRKGMNIHKTGMTMGIGFGQVQDNTRSYPMQTPYSECGKDELGMDDPRWGISPETLIFTKRDATSQGGNVWGWLDDRV